MEIKNIVFDIGNVLLDFCWDKHFAENGIEGEAFDRVARATVKDRLWNEMDRGVMPYEEILKGFIANDPGMETQIRRMLENLNGIVESLPYTDAWISELKGEGYKVFALSNYSEKCFRESHEKMGFLELMDGYVISYMEKLIKPDPKIYRLLLERYGLRAEECVFLDDTPANVKGAEECGMHAILFESREQAVKELKKMGVRTD
ncbi:MAG TPA: HAD family phosphatase [Lachnospiraceae bacterium]|nr:HAD family phosphatase [Lachnospiraceae bacterium]